MSEETPTSYCKNIPEIDHHKKSDDDKLCMRNDNAEVENLESTDSCKNKQAEDDEQITKIMFHCTSCDMEEIAHYFGIEPSFVFGIIFNEPTYVMKAPFQPPPPKRKTKPEFFVAIGAHCKLCNNVVCKDSECSFFFINSYCLNCVKKVASNFPVDVQEKLRKQLALS